MRTTALLVLVFVAVPCQSAQRPRHPYLSRWKHAAFGIRPLAGVTAGAAFAQLRNAPYRWGGGIAGFGKRLGAGLAIHTVNITVEHLVAAPLHEDLDYHPSQERGIKRQLVHALVSTVVVRNTRSGKSRPALGRISGHAAAGVFAEVALSGLSGASTAGIGFAADAGVNVIREFLPCRRYTPPRPAPASGARH